MQPYTKGLITLHLIMDARVKPGHDQNVRP